MQRLAARLEHLQSSPSASSAMVLFSASLDRRSEDVRVLPIVIAKLELGDIERHIFSAHFVECADHAAFEDRPKTFDGLSVDGADDILTARMVNSRVRVIPVEDCSPDIDRYKAS
jgi:hypothetical protein